MEKPVFNYEETCLISKEDILAQGERLKPEINRVREALSQNYTTEYASINLPADKSLLHQVEALTKEKITLKPNILVVIGIGGSNLGTMAVHEAVNGKAYNALNPPVQVYFADTVDEDKARDLLQVVDEELSNGGNVLLNVVTKSGATTETIALFELFKEKLAEYKKEAHTKYIVATTDKDSPLWDFAQAQGYSLLEIPKIIGGRYSVFSSVGLFPLMMLGMDASLIQEGASQMIPDCTSTEILENPAALSAIILYKHFKEGRNINDNFIFATDLEAVGKWYRQLMGESIGKEMNKDGTERVNSGITPTVSIGSTDLHSMAQLYLGGPPDKVTTFISVMRDKTDLILPTVTEFESLAGKIQGRRLSTIMYAIYEGTKIAFKNGNHPYIELILPDKSPFSVAKLLQLKMIEMMYLGFLLGVNPFDQPNVEEYKKETRRILSDG